MLERLAPKVFKHRNNKDLVVFAAEAFTIGSENIDLYKDMSTSKRNQFIT